MRDDVVDESPDDKLDIGREPRDVPNALLPPQREQVERVGRASRDVSGTLRYVVADVVRAVGKERLNAVKDGLQPSPRPAALLQLRRPKRRRCPMGQESE